MSVGTPLHSRISCACVLAVRDQRQVHAELNLRSSMPDIIVPSLRRRFSRRLEESVDVVRIARSCGAATGHRHRDPTLLGGFLCWRPSVI